MFWNQTGQLHCLTFPSSSLSAMGEECLFPNACKRKRMVIPRVVLVSHSSLKPFGDFLDSFHFCLLKFQ